MRRLLRRLGLLLEVPAAASSGEALLRAVELRLGESDDLRRIEVVRGDGARLTALALATSADEEKLRPLLQAWASGSPLEAVLPGVQAVASVEVATEALARGAAAFLESGDGCLRLAAVGRPAARPVEQPSTETVNIGPKEAFTEDLDVDLALLRRRLSTDLLRVRRLEVGTLVRRRLAVVWIDRLTRPELVDTVLDRLRRAKVDAVRGSEDVVQFLLGKDERLTVFPLAQQTERPDLVTEALTQGRLAVFVDGVPFAVVVPTTLSALQKGGDSLLGSPLVAAFVRLLRYVGTTASVLAPPLYTLLMGVNPRFLPPETLLAFAASREGIPYSALLETLLMMVVLDTVVEASQQTPSNVGQTLTIVGGIIIGQVAVQARLVSQLMVIVLAVTAIGSLLAPNLPFGYALRIVKYPLTILAGTLGFFGLAFGAMGLLAHLASLRSLGTPYLAPFGPLGPTGLRLYAVMPAQRPLRTRRPQHYRPLRFRRGEGEA